MAAAHTRFKNVAEVLQSRAGGGHTDGDISKGVLFFFKKNYRPYPVKLLNGARQN